MLWFIPGMGHLQLPTWGLRVILGQHAQLHACLTLKALNLLLYSLGLQTHIVISA